MYNTTFKGYCLIKNNPTTLNPKPKDIQQFVNVPLRIIDAGVDNSYLVVNPKGDEVVMVDSQDVVRVFTCNFIGDVPIPQEMDYIQGLLYYQKLQSRKGGFNEILRRMLIASSLRSGKFNDTFLFQNQ